MGGNGKRVIQQQRHRETNGNGNEQWINYRSCGSGRTFSFSFLFTSNFFFTKIQFEFLLIDLLFFIWFILFTFRVNCMATRNRTILFCCCWFLDSQLFFFFIFVLLECDCMEFSTRIHFNFTLTFGLKRGISFSFVFFFFLFFFLLVLDFNWVARMQILVEYFFHSLILTRLMTIFMDFSDRISLRYRYATSVVDNC